MLIGRSQHCIFVLRAAAVIAALVSGCVSGPPEKTDNPTAQRLVGKTRAELLQCAGTPLREEPYGHGVIFRYYKEAPMFEESRPFLKGSIAQEHHGCWASLLLEKNEVTGVEFRTVPESIEYNHCEEIFAGCTP
jgi:hypothetical protein